MNNSTFNFLLSKKVFQRTGLVFPKIFRVYRHDGYKSCNFELKSGPTRNFRCFVFDAYTATWLIDSNKMDETDDFPKSKIEENPSGEK